MKRLIILLVASIFSLAGAYAQETSKAQKAKDANNPLASIKAVSLHNVYTPSIYGAEASMNTAWIRYAQPIGKVLIRASLPVSSLNAGPLDESGLGDMNVFATYIITKPTARNQFGAGPILTCPTATSHYLGAGKWQLGMALVAYFGGNDIFQGGLLATWQHSFAGNRHRNKAQSATIQPFFMWQLGKGLYLRSTATNVLDLENGNYTVPLGVGAGKVIPVGKVIFNLFAEPQFTLWHKGAGTPKFQCYVGINTQF